MRILVIDDSSQTSEYICGGLREHLFLADSAENGQKGLQMAIQGDYDAIVLDIMMPIMDGWMFIKKLRQKDSQTPVLFLTARDEVDDRVKGFELGADDYLIKPFAFAELLARIRALLRRQQPQLPALIQIADLSLDVMKQKVMRGTTQIHLSAKEFLLLLFLAKRSGEVLSRTLIAAHVWDIHFDCDTNAIDVAVKRLRDKMDTHFTEKLIHTIRGAGYVLEKR